jgi:hypothetical protein
MSTSELRRTLAHVLELTETARRELEAPAVWGDPPIEAPEELNEAIFSLQRLIDFGKL